MSVLLIGTDNYTKYDPPAPERATPRLTDEGKQIKFKDLNGAVNDVLAMREYLVNVMKVDPHCIAMLLAPLPGVKYRLLDPRDRYEMPTYQNIVEAFEKLASKAREAGEGHLVYIHYCGHGSRASTVFGGTRRLKEDGEEDECIVPCDVTRGGNFLRDLEIGALLQDIVDAKALLTVVFDCCHSGGAVRGEDDKYPDTDDEDKAEADQQRYVKGIYKSDLRKDLPHDSMMKRIGTHTQCLSWMQAPENFVFLAACLERQTAKERSFAFPDNTRQCHGYLTYWLLDTIRDSPLVLSSMAILHRVRSKISLYRVDQTPQLHGDRWRFFFEKDLRPRIHSVPVLKVIKPSDPLRFSVTLNAGSSEFVHLSSVYAILPLHFAGWHVKESDILAKVKVIDVQDFESTADPVGWGEPRWDDVVEGCPAVLYSLPVDRRSLVRFSTVDKDQRHEFELGWKRHRGDEKWLKLAGENDNKSVSFTITIDCSDNYNYKVEDHLGILEPHLSADLGQLRSTEEDSMPRLINRLEHLLKFIMIRVLRTPDKLPNGPSPLVSVDIRPAEKGRMIKTKPKRIEKAEKIEQNKKGDYWDVEESRLFQFNITNRTHQALGCVILCIMPEFGVSCVFPARSTSGHVNIPPGDSKTAVLWVDIPETLRSAAKKGIPIIDTFKVFTSFPEKDLDSLCLKKLREVEDTGDYGVRGDEDDQLDLLLKELYPASRDGYGCEDSDTELEDDGTWWKVQDIRVRVRHSKIEQA